MNLKIGNKYIWTGNDLMYECLTENDEEWELREIHKGSLSSWLVATKGEKNDDLIPVIDVGFKFDYKNPFSDSFLEYEIIADCGDNWRLKYLPEGITHLSTKAWLTTYLNTVIPKKKPRCIN